MRVCAALLTYTSCKIKGLMDGVISLIQINFHCSGDLNRLMQIPGTSLTMQG